MSPPHYLPRIWHFLSSHSYLLDSSITASPLQLAASQEHPHSIEFSNSNHQRNDTVTMHLLFILTFLSPTTCHPHPSSTLNSTLSFPTSTANLTHSPSPSHLNLTLPIKAPSDDCHIPGASCVKREDCCVSPPPPVTLFTRAAMLTNNTL